MEENVVVEEVKELNVVLYDHVTCLGPYGQEEITRSISIGSVISLVRETERSRVDYVGAFTRDGRVEEYRTYKGENPLALCQSVFPQMKVRGVTVVLNTVHIFSLEGEYERTTVVPIVKY